MSHEIRADYNQVMMFPPCIEDWVGEDHPARFIRTFVDMLDLKALGFRVSDSDVGRPPFASDMLLEVWLYGFFNRIRSSRKLEKACREHMGLIWLTGMKSPDHNTLWRFLDSNKKAMPLLFKQSVQVAAKCKLIGMVVNALDGTKIRAATSREGVLSLDGLEKQLERVEPLIADFMTEVERLEKEESGEYRLPASMACALKRKDQVGKAMAEVQESGRKRIHHREPEARFMKNRRSIEPSFNAQAVADKDNGIIVAQDVVTDETDNGQLVRMLDKVKENMGRVADENLGDGGFNSSSQIGLAEERGYEVLVNAPSNETPSSRSKKSAVYHTSCFVYDEDRNCCVCPHGRDLPYCKTKERGSNHNVFRVYRCREYRSCPYRSKCSENKRGREIEVSVHYKTVERQRAKRRDPAKKALLAMRKSIIEPIFAWIKHHLGFNRWTVYGLERVKAQWAFVCTTLNLTKLYKYWLSKGLPLAAE